MTITTERTKGQIITALLNATVVGLKTVVPVNHQLSKPELLGNSLHLQYGVLIGVTGDVKGKLIFAGDTNLFAKLGEGMFGMPLEGDMLASFSGELGNMLAGSIATTIAKDGIQTDITAPTIMQGKTTLSGYEKALHLTTNFENTGVMDIYLLLD
ncbi:MULTISPECIES: chemotaxis protein CheX [unclassified Virgibacillus]|uniref:chemotaxis protein CheX n=1 Tax=unclassified Virgibacillus TaxID=2620237 RepID=UPI0024DE64D4|nr:chemotaxis protein CheX [Virgibacillus sp. LDC-1]